MIFVGGFFTMILGGLIAYVYEDERSWKENLGQLMVQIGAGMCVTSVLILIVKYMP
jgi:hypothetical protein